MISLLLIFINTLLGIFILKLIKIKLNSLELFFGALIIGPLFFTIVNFVLALFIPFKTSIVILLLLNVVLIFFHLQFFKKFFKTVFREIKKELSLILLLLIFLLCFVWLYPKVGLQSSKYGWHVGRNTFGDTQFHAAIITAFAYGNNFPPQNPIFSGNRLVYPFFSDFYSSIILKLDSSLQEAIVVPTIAFSLNLVCLIFLFTKNFTKRNCAPFLAAILSLFNGGLGFVYFFIDNQGNNLIEAFKNINKEYTHLFEETINIHITNLMGGFLAPERSLLFGLPLFILFLLLLYKQKDKFSINSNLILASIMFGLMPYIHTHGFFVFLGLSIFYTFIDCFNDKRKIEKWFIYWLIATPLFLIQFMKIFPQIGRINKFVRFRYGWLKKTNENIVWFWYKNLGFQLPILFFALLMGKIRKNLKLFFFPFLGIFLLINLFQFQPFDWDNVKFLLFFLLATNILISLFIESLLTNKIKYLLFIPIFIILILSGVISFIGEPQLHLVLFSKKELETAEFIKRNTEPEAVFLSAPQHNCPASSLAGRKILMGYPGYLWTQGIDYHQREIEVKKMYQSIEFLPLIKKYQVRYVLIGPTEKETFKNLNFSFFEKNFEKIFDNGVYKIFKI